MRDIIVQMCLGNENGNEMTFMISLRGRQDSRRKLGLYLGRN